MRWKAKPQPKLSDVRIIDCFLWLPKCVNDEWRWLENARISQQYCYEGVWKDLDWLCR